MRPYRIFVAICLALLLSLSGCATVDTAIAKTTPEEIAARLALASDAQSYEAELGWASTPNFHVASEAMQSLTLCFYSAKLDLVLEYIPPEQPCDKDRLLFDVYEYKAEAAAGIRMPLLPALIKSKPARFIMVVFHEDYHEQLIGIPSSALNESATTLIGLLAARDFVALRYGEDSEIKRLLAADIELHLDSSRVLMRYFTSLETIYGKVKAGTVTTEDALLQKNILFAAMAEECKGFVMSAVASCAKPQNNAQISFQYQYSVHYPMFYNLHIACGGKTKLTAERIISLAHAGLTEIEFIARVNTLITNGCAT